jgi:hypothetical protein
VSFRDVEAELRTETLQPSEEVVRDRNLGFEELGNMTEASQSLENRLDRILSVQLVPLVRAPDEKLRRVALQVGKEGDAH